MNGPHGAEVALVKGRNLGFAQTLGERDDTGVDHPKLEVRIPSLKLLATFQVRYRRRLDPIDAREHIVEEDEPGLGRKPAGAPVVEFGEHQRRHDEILVRWGEESGTTIVIGIGRIEGGKQGAGVADECHGSARLFGHRLGRDVGCAAAIG